MLPGDGDVMVRARARGVFLATLAATGNVSASAREAGISRKTAYQWRSKDAEFASDWRDAEESATDALEAEARRRAVEGWDEPVWHQGEQCGTVRRYSDRMLEILLKGHRKEFRESRLELSGPDGGPIPQKVAHEFTDEHYAALIRTATAAGFVANGAAHPAPPAPPVGGAAPGSGGVAS